MLNKSIEKSIIDFERELIKILYKNNRINKTEYDNALRIYEKKLEVYFDKDFKDGKNVILEIKI